MRTILHTVVERAKTKPGSPALLYKVQDRWIQESWGELYDRVECLAYALDHLGIRRGDRIGIQAWTCPEWTVADLAATLMGVIIVPLYPQYPAPICRYILDHAGVVFLFCEDQEQLDKIQTLRADLPALANLALFNPSPAAGPQVPTLAELVVKGREIRQTSSGLIEGWLEVVRPEDVMTIVYTSGTTGPPKGVVLSNRGFDFGIEAITRLMAVKEGERLLAFLPLAHVYERFMQYLGLANGIVYSYAGSIERLTESLKEIRPHYMPGVPRVYEKAYSAILGRIESGPRLKGLLAHWAIGVGRRVVEARQSERPIGPLLRLQHEAADRLVFRKIRQALGGNLRIAAVSAAPISAEICTFFNSIGVTLLEAWGMTETTAPVTVNPPDKPRMGTAGLPFEGAELKIAEDGEILVKAPNVLLEYYRDEEATRAAFDQDGFFYTGDLGRLDEKGYLQIIGRKKDILITSYGKNISVRNIEERFLMESIFAGCVVLGDGKPYLTAVFSLAEEPLLRWAREQGMTTSRYQELVGHPKTREMVQARVNAINQELARVEQVRDFVLADHPFSVETGEMTPTLKFRRSEVAKRYRKQVEELYRNQRG
ncbi:MAG: long-chain fatty acid--CoA ligase [Bradymonadales bacterium]|nr:long-chain fatty acid--CoA ligase [Bradymonadales bacterium]